MNFPDKLSYSKPTTVVANRIHMPLLRLDTSVVRLDIGMPGFESQLRNAIFVCFTLHLHCNYITFTLHIYYTHMYVIGNVLG